MIRNDTHAGSWYVSDPNALEQQLDGFLECAQVKQQSQMLKALIAPHAGYRYSGETAGYAYKLIDPDAVERVVLLGPSHKVWLDTCALSVCKYYKTPFGNIEIDSDCKEKLISE
jgi:AmmeMemoRadiSam system protein B